ncbi:MAG: hypothetical protein HY825_13330 [Acidobacteria bacterium]|nr:hypothetical protein [Acidobacteriota bacterium]
MKLFGDGRAALADDPATADALGWSPRRRSRPVPAVVLRPRTGDPCREPWIAPPGWAPSPGASALWRRREAGDGWTYLPHVPGVRRYLRALAETPAPDGARVGLIGLGRVGGTAATALASLPFTRSGIRELLISDSDEPNERRWQLELESIAEWHGHTRLPRVRRASADELFATCSAMILAAAAGVPPIGSSEDVRLAQLAPNRGILQDALRRAREADFAGLFLVVSDPVEILAQAAFHDSNADAAGRFTGAGLAPERIAGLALAVMWARALACARERGWEAEVRRRGAPFGPHSTEVVVFDDVVRPDAERSACLTRAAREGNFRLRDLGYLPYVGPAVSSIALTLPPLLAGREVLASVALDGVFFGAPARLEWGAYPTARRIGPAARADLDALHAMLRTRAASFGTLFQG